VLDGRVALDPFVERFPMENVQEVLTRTHAHELGRRPVLVNPPQETTP
jgi:6-hydroxycyclohex-1-ene-1-carbonyl-CoA dehydrogenase